MKAHHGKVQAWIKKAKVWAGCRSVSGGGKGKVQAEGRKVAGVGGQDGREEGRHAMQGIWALWQQVATRRAQRQWRGRWACRKGRCGSGGEGAW